MVQRFKDLKFVLIFLAVEVLISFGLLFISLWIPFICYDSSNPNKYKKGIEVHNENQYYFFNYSTFIFPNCRNGGNIGWLVYGDVPKGYLMIPQSSVKGEIFPIYLIPWSLLLFALPSYYLTVLLFKGKRNFLRC